MSEELQVNKINGDIRGTLQEFLTDVRHQKTFQKMAMIVGCTSRKPEKYQAALFTVVDGEIGFVIGELNVMFVDWQIERSLLKDPTIAEIIKGDPELLEEYIEASKLYIYGEQDIDPKDPSELN